MCFPYWRGPHNAIYSSRMIKNKFTYRINAVITSIVVWELVFWVLMGIIFFILGYFGNGNQERIDFVSPNTLWLTLLLVPIALFYIYTLQKRNKLFELAGEPVRKHMFQEVSSARSFFKFFLFRNAFVLLIIAMAQPVFGSKKVSGTVESMELAICLDISNSMNVKDIDSETSRLTIAKRAITQLINNLHGEKIGVCVFANSAFTQLPITIDYDAAKMYVNDIESNMISSQGTNIKAALENCVSMFSSNEESTKGIILVTDGENHEEDPNKILEEIKEKKIQLVVLGLGTRKGGLVPKNPERPELGYKSTPMGTTVLSKLDPQFINEIAFKGGGTATLSSDPFPNLSSLLKQINRMKKTKLEAMQFDVKESRYQWPLFLSIVCWILFLTLTSTVFKSIDQFTEKK